MAPQNVAVVKDYSENNLFHFIFKSVGADSSTWCRWVSFETESFDL